MTGAQRTNRWGAARLVLALAVAGLLVASCGADPERIDEQRTNLPPGAAAEVGDQTVQAVSVARIAQAQGITKLAARELAVSDALYGAAARDQLSAGQIRVVQRAEAARALYAELKREAAAGGIPTDAEIEQLTSERWLIYDRPEAARTSHAVVLLSADGDTDEGAARALAERIREATQGAADQAAFASAAKAVPTGGLKVTVEALPPVALDGRIVNPEAPAAPGQGLDQDFARTALAIPTQGAISPVTKTRFGFHVIYLAERLAQHHVPLAERRKLLEPAVMARRVQIAEQKLLQRAQVAHPIEVSRAVDSLTALVQVRP